MWDDEVASDDWSEVVSVLMCSERDVTSLTSVSFCVSHQTSNYHERRGRCLPLVCARLPEMTALTVVASLPPFGL